MDATPPVSDEDELGSLRAELAAQRDRSARLQADFENFQRRSAQRLADESAYATARMITKLLPVLDSLDNARDEGGARIAAQLHGLLEREGLKRIPTRDEKFDAAKHEALQAIPGKTDDIIAEEVLAGYEFNGCVIRPAKVNVYRKTGPSMACEKMEEDTDG